MFWNFVFCKLGCCQKAVGDSVPGEHIDSTLEIESWAPVKLVKTAANINKCLSAVKKCWCLQSGTYPLVNLANDIP